MASRNTFRGVFVALMLLAACVTAMDQFGSEVGVTFGSVVRLISPHTGFMYLCHHPASIPTISSLAEEE
jgi:hypothetical protein